MRHNYDVQRALTRPWGMQVCECGALFADWAQMRDDHLLPLRYERSKVQHARRNPPRQPVRREVLTLAQRNDRRREQKREQYRLKQRRLGREVLPIYRYRVAASGV